MAERRFDDAIRLYGALAEALPGVAGVRLNLGLAHHSAGQYDRSAGILRQVVREEPGIASAWIVLGTGLVRLGQLEEAARALDRALALEPESVMARRELAGVQLALSRFGDAAGSFKQLSELAPGDAKAWRGLALAYNGVSQEAARLLETHGADSGYWDLLLGRSLTDRKRYGNAFFHYKQALQRLPRSRGAHLGLAEIYREYGRDDWAAEAQRRAARLPPPECPAEPLECAFAEGAYGEILARTEHAAAPAPLYWRARAAGELSRQAFARLVELPPSAELHASLAEIEALSGRYVDAAKHFEVALELEPGSDTLAIKLAEALWNAQDYTALEPLATRLLDNRPGVPLLRFLKGDALLEQGRAEDAVPHLEAAAKDPKLVAARASLGRAYLNTNRPEDAIPHLEAAIQADREGRTQYQLAQAYQRAGRQDDARRMLQRYQEIQRENQRRGRQREDDIQITAPPAGPVGGSPSPDSAEPR